MFPSLAPRPVRINPPGGEFFDVQLLPCGLYDQFARIAESVTSDAESKVSGRKLLREMIAPYWPTERMKYLDRLNYEAFVVVVSTLFFGNDESENNAKNRASAEPDMEFLAARILAAYPGYTLESLWKLPFPALFRLAGLTHRVYADRAIGELVPGVSAALNGGKSFESLISARGRFDLQPEGEHTPQQLTPEMEEILERRLDRVLAGEYTVIQSVGVGKQKSVRN